MAKRMETEKHYICVMKRICYILFLFLTGLQITGQQLPAGATPVNEHGLVKWLNFKEAQELNKKQAKPFLIDVYTDWCGWCKHMMRTTYADQGIANYINTYFYPVKFDAETKDTIEYNGVKYHNPGKEKKSVHQLAVKLLGTQLSYPSTIFVSNNFQFNLLSQGYLEVRKLEPLLIYTVENVYRTTAYEDFSVNFEKTFYDTSKTPVSEKLKWYSMKEALELHKKKPKKIIVDVYTGFCNACKVMNKTSFHDPKLIEYLNEHYYLVDFNAESKDPITFNSNTYQNTGANGFPFHSLSLVLTRNNLVLPSLCILDENLQIVDVVGFYLSGKSLDPIVHYFGDNAYKTKKWEEYLKEKENIKKK